MTWTLVSQLTVDFHVVKASGVTKGGGATGGSYNDMDAGVSINGHFRKGGAYYAFSLRADTIFAAIYGILFNV